MRIQRVGPAKREHGRPGRRARRFREGERVVATVVRAIAGPLVLLDVEGVRLVAWMEREAAPKSELYLEVLTGAPVPRFRRLTGGPSFWSLPVGKAERSKLNTTV